MKKTVYKNRIKRKLRDAKVKVPKAELDAAINEGFGKKPPSVVAMSFMPKSTKRKDAKSKAEEAFGRILDLCCKEFKQNRADAQKVFDNNWLDLRSAAAFIGLKKLKIRPASAMADLMGIKTPAAVYHAAYRGERLMKDKIIFSDAVNSVLTKLSKKK